MGEALLMIRFLKAWIGAAIVLPAAVHCRAAEVFPVVHNEPIVVRVLDGKDGKPQAHRRVALTGWYDQRDLSQGQWHEEAITGSDGVVRLSNNLRNLPMLRVEVMNSHACEPESNLAAVGVERVRLSGLNGEDRCGSVIAAEMPGVLTVFVKGKKSSGRDFTIAAGPVSLAGASSVAVASAAPSAPTFKPDKVVYATNGGDPASAAAKEPATKSTAAPVEPEAHVSMLLSYALDNLAGDVPSPPSDSKSVSVRLSTTATPRASVHRRGSATGTSGAPASSSAAPRTAKAVSAAPGAKTAAGQVSTTAVFSAPAVAPEPVVVPASAVVPAIGRPLRHALSATSDRVSATSTRNRRRFADASRHREPGHKPSAITRLDATRADTTRADTIHAGKTRTDAGGTNPANLDAATPLAAGTGEMPVFRLREHASAGPSKKTALPSALSPSHASHAQAEPSDEDASDPLCAPDGP